MNLVGTTITYSSGFLAQILEVSDITGEIPMVDTTHAGTTGGRSNKPGELPSWEMTCRIAFNPSVDPPIGTQEAVEIAWSDSASSTWAYTYGTMDRFSARGMLEERATADCHFTFSGDVEVS